MPATDARMLSVTSRSQPRDVIRFVPARDVDASLAAAFVHSVHDAVAALGDPARFVTQTEQRIVAATDPDHPEALWFVTDEWGPAGWAGWSTPEPGAGLDGVWESTTFLAPRLRGSDAFARAKCHQVHASGPIARAHPSATFVSAIAHTNARSLKATRTFFAAHGWPVDEQVVHSVAKGRPEHRFAWPHPHFSPQPHGCFRAEAEARAS